MARSPARRVTTALKQTKSAVGAGAAMAKTVRAGAALTLAAGQTIAQRGALLRGMGADAQRRAQGEMLRMVPEKVFAGAEASFAMWGHAARLNTMLMNYWTGHTLRLVALASSLMTSRSPLGAVSAILRSAESGVAQNVAVGLSGVRSVQAIAQAGAKPLQRVAAANAKRLTRAAQR